MPRGPREPCWFENHMHIFMVGMDGSGVPLAAFSVSFGNTETIPFTERIHRILFFEDKER